MVEKRGACVSVAHDHKQVFKTILNPAILEAGVRPVVEDPSGKIVVAPFKLDAHNSLGSIIICWIRL